MKKLVLLLTILTTMTLYAATYEKVMQLDKFGEETGSFVMMTTENQGDAVLAIDKTGTLAFINGYSYVNGYSVEVGIKVDETVFDVKGIAVSNKILGIKLPQDVLEALFKGKIVKFSVNNLNGDSKVSKFDLIGFKETYKKTIEQPH